MELTIINREDFDYLTCHEDWTELESITEFESNGIKCKLRLADLMEAGMSNYTYLDVKFFKGNKLLQSGEMRSSKYYVPVSPNKNFIYIPFKGGAELINLATEEKFESSVNWFVGNIYNQSSTKMIINGSDEYKIIDLLEMKEINHLKERKYYNNDAFFIDDDTILQLIGNNKIEALNLITEEKKVISIKSPFDKFGIEKEKYQSLIDKNTYCLKMPSGGMIYSKNLDNWAYVSTKEKIILHAVIPTSGIKYSKGYERGYCEVEHKYIEIKKEYYSQ